MLTKLRKRRTLTVVLSVLLILALVVPQAAVGLDDVTSDIASSESSDTPLDAPIVSETEGDTPTLGDALQSDPLVENNPVDGGGAVRK